MSKVLIEDSTLKNIADTIREKTGYDSMMLPSEMPIYISEIDTENVTVDGYKVIEPLDLYTYSDSLIRTIDPSDIPSAPIGIKKILNDRNFIYYSSNYNSTNYIHTTTLKYVTMSLEEKSEINITTEMINGCENIDIILHQNSELDKFWLIITYEYDEHTYFSVYEIAISDGMLTFVEKCTNIMSYCTKSYGVLRYSDLLVDLTGLYVAEGSPTSGNIELTTFQFDTTTGVTTMEKIYSITVDNQNNKGFLLKKGDTNQYYYFYNATTSNYTNLINNYIYITRTNTTSFSNSEVVTMSQELSMITMYEYNGSFYGVEEESSYFKLQKLSGNNWEDRQVYDKDNENDGRTFQISISGRPMEYEYITTSDEGYFQQQIYIINNFNDGSYTSIKTPQINTYNGIKMYDFLDYIKVNNYYKLYFSFICHGANDIGYDGYEECIVAQTPLLYSSIEL